MFRKRTSAIFVGILALVFIFASVGCEKLSVKKLSANYAFSKANQLFKDAKYSKAIVEYEKTVKNNPNLKEAYRFLGESYKNLYIPGKENPENVERSEKALAALKKAYELEPTNKDVIYSLGDMYDRLRNFDEAEKMYLRIVELEPGNMNNYYVVAEFYKRYAGDNQELKEKARAMYLRRIETDPENVQGYAYMADYYDKLPPDTNKNKFDVALSYVKRREILEPNSAVVFYTIGINRYGKCYTLQNFLSQAEKEALANEAEKNLLKAIELDPSWPEPIVWMRVLYLNVHAKVFPEKESRYLELASQYGMRYDEARKRQLDRIKLEKELKKTV